MILQDNIYSSLFGVAWLKRTMSRLRQTNFASYEESTGSPVWDSPVWSLFVSSIMTVECLCVCNDRVRCGSTRRLMSGRRRRVMRTVTQTTVSVMSLTAWHCHCLTTTHWQPRRPTSRTDSMLITIWPVTWTDHVLGKCSTYIRRDYFIMSPPPESIE